MQDSFTPTNARKHFFDIVKQVSSEHKPATVQSKDENQDVVIVNKHDWDAMQEALYLSATGTLAEVQKREADNSGWTDIDSIDWEKL